MAQIRHTRTEIIVIDKYVKASWTRRNRKHYESLGYIFSKYKNDFIIPVHHALGNEKIKVSCPLCCAYRRVNHEDISRTGHTFCKGCAKIRDLRGQVFGALTVLDIDKKSIKSQIRWECKCECGEKVIHLGGNLVAGRALSCGCHVLQDRIIKQRIRKEKRANRNNLSGYRSWKDYIKKRAGWRCEACGEMNKSSNLVAHHIYSYNKFPEKILDPDNGACLCRKCHYDFHCNYMGGWKIICTRIDYNNWLSGK